MAARIGDTPAYSLAEFCESGFDLLRRSEAAFRGIAQPAFDAGDFFRRRLIVASLKSSIKVEREFGKCILRLGRPTSMRSRTSVNFLVFMMITYRDPNRCLRQQTRAARIARGKSVLGILPVGAKQGRSSAGWLRSYFSGP